MNKHKSFIGVLLRVERLSQGKGQKEICFGICVTSYLSKIERGLVTPDDTIVGALFERLGITYHSEEEFLTRFKTMLQEYFKQTEYGLDTTQFQTLKEYEHKLRFSPLALDWMIVCALQGESYLQILDECVECMTQQQLMWYYIIEREQEDKKTSLERYQRAYEISNKSFILIKIMECYIDLGDYYQLHHMADRCIHLALEEGNTYALALCYILQGTAYACLDIEPMMIAYYERAMNLLQNTSWNVMFESIYYNMGAVYLSLEQYDQAMKYLDLVTKEDFSVSHKKALVMIRSGNKDKAKPYMEQMRLLLNVKEEWNQSNGSCKEASIEMLMYQEVRMELEENFLGDPNYLILMDELIKRIQKERHFGFLYFYKDVCKEAYCRQRKYRKALELEGLISLKARNSSF